MTVAALSPSHVRPPRLPTPAAMAGKTLINTAHGTPGNTALAFSRDGAYIYTGGADCLGRIWKTDHGTDQDPDAAMEAGEAITCVASGVCDAHSLRARADMSSERLLVHGKRRLGCATLHEGQGDPRRDGHQRDRCRYSLTCSRPKGHPDSSVFRVRAFLCFLRWRADSTQ